MSTLLLSTRNKVPPPSRSDAHGAPDQHSNFHSLQLSLLRFDTAWAAPSVPSRSRSRLLPFPGEIILPVTPQSPWSSRCAIRFWLFMLVHCLPGDSTGPREPGLFGNRVLFPSARALSKYRHLGVKVGKTEGGTTQTCTYFLDQGIRASPLIY